MCSENHANEHFTYLEVRGAELFTVVCLPQENGAFPTVIMRLPYVDAMTLQLR